MSEQFNIDLPPRFQFNEGEDNEERLEVYLDKLNIQLDEMFKRLWKRTIHKTVPCCRIYTDTDRTIVHDTWTAIAFNKESFDDMVMHDNVTNNSRMTIPDERGGIYLIGGACPFDANVTGIRTLRIYKNGVQGTQLDHMHARNDCAQLLHGSAIVEAVAGDYFELFVYQDSTGNLNTENGANTVYGWCVKI